ncbi:MAG: aminotransferase class III-fold pyridoxal phosphate-dependent enzyme [Bryobacterales bacterium]|nr:aminotransferase class III-fold pyridoxal phosphate-dependent enzyme [Bryobacterales bacterium]
MTQDLTAGSHYWMPFTPNRDFQLHPKLVIGAKDQYYTDAAGRRILDGLSGLYTSPAGHGRESIADAVSRQLRELDFVPGFLRAHPKVYELTQRLTAMLPAALNHAFYVNSGSEAIDTAMKLCLAYHRARGEASRTLFVSRERAYHGVNLGGIALGGLAGNRRVYTGALPHVFHMRHTALPENRFTPGQPKHGAELADDLLRLVQLHGAENIAACFVEPIAGSTGVLPPPVGYLDRLREICTAHGILLVFDEVICGFGRTGKAFAAQTFGVTPDVMTLAKAITNGALPMAAVAVNDRIRDTIFQAAPDGAIEFYHGYTWSSHPVCCAAALAAFDIYEGESLFARGEALAPYFQQQLFTLADLPVVTDVRGFSMLGGIDLKPSGAPGSRGYEVQKKLFDRGLHLKNTGDAITLAPQLIFTREQVDEMIAVLRTVLQECKV